MKLYLLLGMLFLHIVDDYYLQGWLASARQKSWWKKIRQTNYIPKIILWRFVNMRLVGHS